MTTLPRDLAVLGAPPAFPRELHVGRPNLGDRSRTLERLADMLDRRWLTNHGPFVEMFERRLAEYLGVRHCVTTSNCTTALEVVVRAAGLSGEVIVPSFTFIATAHALRWSGIRPVFCDVDATTHTVDPDHAERLITPRTTGIVGVHLWGRPCSVERLGEIADDHGLILLFDAAHAFGCTMGGQLIARFGNAEVFSFHATKVLNTFEGGAVTTDDDDLAARVRLMIDHGFADQDEVVSLGTNAKMSEAAAAMGLTSLESLDAFIEHNRQNHSTYCELLADLPGIEVLRFEERERHNYHYVVAVVDETSPLSRDELHQLLWAEGVLARRYFRPGCHRMEPYRSENTPAQHRLPVTEQLSEQVLCLPTGTSVLPSDVATVCHLLRMALDGGDAVRAALTESSPRRQV